MMTTCVQPRAGAATVGRVAADSVHAREPADQATRRWRSASAVIAVELDASRDDLRARAPELAATPLYTIPNPVDMTRARRACTTGRRARWPEPYVLYAGKLATNKGVQFLLPRRRRTPASPGRSSSSATARCARRLEAEARRARRRPCAMLGWLIARRGLAWMRHATLLAFPSYGPESLSRVLIEAAALGVPIAAMDTGGTRDIITHGHDGPALGRPGRIRARSRAARRRRAAARVRSAHAARVDVHVALLGAVGRRARRAGLPHRCCCREAA